MVKRLLTLYTDHIYSLPILVLMPHSRCNCRCVMCDIWKANHEKKELSIETLKNHVQQFQKLGVRQIVLSGGEALMYADLWKFCELAREKNISLTLLSTGLLLEKNAEKIVAYFNEVIVSIDGSEEIHNKIRNIPDGFKKIQKGIHALRQQSRQYRVTARCVLQHGNFFDFNQIIGAAKKLELDQISFLAADVSTSAFNRRDSLTSEKVMQIALNMEEVNRLEEIIEHSFSLFRDEYANKFIAESPRKMRQIVQYYRALNGLDNFPRPVCNAPWVSAVIDSEGNVSPCFFHPPQGNIHKSTLSDILNSKLSIDFRKNLKMDTDPICSKCVCSLKLGITG
jgi:Fe-coproporphyrin III synthase